MSHAKRCNLYPCRVSHLDNSRLDFARAPDGAKQLVVPAIITLRLNAIVELAKQRRPTMFHRFLIPYDISTRR